VRDVYNATSNHQLNSRKYKKIRENYITNEKLYMMCCTIVVICRVVRREIFSLQARQFPFSLGIFITRTLKHSFTLSASLFYTTQLRFRLIWIAERESLSILRIFTFSHSEESEREKMFDLCKFSLMKITSLLLACCEHDKNRNLQCTHCAHSSMGFSFLCCSFLSFQQ
jgi:hypothetical protein